MKSTTLRKLQYVELEILKHVSKICEENELEYYLIGGTLLGAIRHKGFIPWDDDIDIVMPRKDYERFLKLSEDILDEKYYLHHIKTDNKYWHSFAKVKKKGTLIDEKLSSNINCNKGIFIDIFPLDNANKQYSLKQKIQAKIVKSLYPIIFYRCGAKKELFSKKLIIISNMTKILSIKSLYIFRDLIMSINKDSSSKYYINLGSQYNYVKQTIPKDKYYPPIKVEFEGELFNAPNDYDYILRRIYGDDYMELPPEEKRVNHSALKIIFDTEEKNEEI